MSSKIQLPSPEEFVCFLYSNFKKPTTTIDKKDPFKAKLLKLWSIGCMLFDIEANETCKSKFPSECLSQSCLIASLLFSLLE